MCTKNILDNVWVQRFLPAFVMAVFVTGGVYWQLADMKLDVSRMQQDMEALKIDQSKDNEFRKSSERFSQHDGTTLELRSRDYTDHRIAVSLDKQSEIFTEIKASLVRVNDKIDKLASTK